LAFGKLIIVTNNYQISNLLIV